MYSWRKLDEKELTRVYLDEMRRDFPPTELKPLSMILNSEANGTAPHGACSTAKHWRRTCSWTAGSRVSQLDYFAVLPEYRSAGLGAQLLADLPQQSGVRRPSSLRPNARIRRRTKLCGCAAAGLFYSRCGARDTGFTEHPV